MSNHRTPQTIIGAGLAGMIAGYAFPGVPIYESASAGAAPHRALLRFRSDAVSRLTGIPFRRVRVHKGIWSRGAYAAPNPRLANLYARKCIGLGAGDRSIWSVDAVDRWVAPETLIDQMSDALAGRIHYDAAIDFSRFTTPAAPVINTAPLPVALASLCEPIPEALFARARIWTRRYRIPGADAYQTVYLPDHTLTAYRASITGNLLIVEFRDDSAVGLQEELDEVCAALGLDADALEPIDTGANEHKYGKIISLPDNVRKPLLARLTIERSIYSLGRFATWRNILLDDVVHDAEVIRRMLHSGVSGHYHALRAVAGAPEA